YTPLSDLLSTSFQPLKTVSLTMPEPIKVCLPLISDVDLMRLAITISERHHLYPVVTMWFGHVLGAEMERRQAIKEGADTTTGPREIALPESWNNHRVADFLELATVLSYAQGMEATSETAKFLD